MSELWTSCLLHVFFEDFFAFSTDLVSKYCEVLIFQEKGMLGRIFHQLCLACRKSKKLIELIVSKSGLKNILGFFKFSKQSLDTEV